MGDVESGDVVKVVRQSELEEFTKNKVSSMNKNLITLLNTIKHIEYTLTNKKEENKENDKGHRSPDSPRLARAPPRAPGHTVDHSRVDHGANVGEYTIWGSVDWPSARGIGWGRPKSEGLESSSK